MFITAIVMVTVMIPVAAMITVIVMAAVVMTVPGLRRSRATKGEGPGNDGDSRRFQKMFHGDNPSL